MMAIAHLPEKTELLEPGVKISGFIKWSSKMTLSRWASALAVFSAIQPAEDSFYRFSRLQSNFAFSQMSP
jgi:Ser-tRNA(Ala) deacylase AlaX